jgi:hypothetical protein
MQNMNKIPTLLVLFNRPELVRESMASIRRYRPARLYLAADGPRPGREGEVALCARARAAALEAVDWDCDVRTLFRDQNVGCGRGVSEAITWMFKTEEYGIIIEDDCIVSPDFFRMCEELLPMYKDDERVAQVNGFMPLKLRRAQAASYSFAAYPEVWGWATWRRAWQHIDFEMGSWRAQRLRIFLRFNLVEACFHLVSASRLYRQLKRGQKPDIWDKQWGLLYVLMGKKCCITPHVNLVRNSGFGEASTNCPSEDSVLSRIPCGRLDFPLAHPTSVAADKRTSRAYARFLTRLYVSLLQKKIIHLINPNSEKYS